MHPPHEITEKGRPENVVCKGNLGQEKSNTDRDTMNTAKDMDSSSVHQEHEEDIAKPIGGDGGHAPTSEAARHGDRAMQLVGEERVVLTEEDVCINYFFLSLVCLLFYICLLACFLAC